MSLVQFRGALLLLALAAPLSAQQSSTGEQTIRTTTRIVIVDVVATDRSGQPVTDLTAENFTILENGKPQVLAAGSAEGEIGQAAPPTPELPPGVFSNRPEFSRPRGNAPVILLLDGLNTTYGDQEFMRRKLLEYLKTQVARETPIAIFALSNSLIKLQDFSADPNALIAALQRFSTDEQAQSTLRDSNLKLSSDISQDSGYAARDGARSTKLIIDSLLRFQHEHATVATGQRVRTTLAALEALAQAVAGMPGRKKLLWVSGSFPINRNPFGTTWNEELRATSAALSHARVAVYPVDARGLLGPGIHDAESRGLNEAGYLRLGPEYGDHLIWEADRKFFVHDTMEELASNTGGIVFKNRNDIDRAVALGTADARTYYALSYYPTDKSWDGRFRRIEVKVNRPGVTLRYRRGYHAIDVSGPRPENRVQIAQNLAEMDAPSASQVLFEAKVIPPVRAGAAAQVQFLVDPRTLIAVPEKDGHRVNLDAFIVAYDHKGELALNTGNSVSALLSLEDLAEVAQRGLLVSVELPLAAGPYRLRLIVRDNHAHTVGALAATLEVPAMYTLR